MKALALFLLFRSVLAQGPCPTNVVEWTKWRRDTVKALGQSEFDYRNYSDFLTGCEKAQATLFSQNPSLKNCLQNLKSYLSRKSDFLSAEKPYSENDSGWTVSASEYWRSTKHHTQLPPFLARDKRLLELLRDATSLKQAKEYLSQRAAGSGFRVYEFDGSSFGSSIHRGRMIIEVPGNPHQYVLVALEQPPNGGGRKTTIATLTEVATPEGRKEVYFGPDWEIDSVGKPVVASPPKHCLDCHANGALAIRPLSPSQLGAPESEAIQAFNRRIENSGPVSLPFANLDGMGPGFGYTRKKKARTADFFNRCSLGKIKSTTSADRVESAMNCANCHDGLLRSKLFPENLRGIDLYIRKGFMPPSHHLNPPLTSDEKEALVSCLFFEYAGEDGILSDWLNEMSCDSSPTKRHSPGRDRNH